MMNKYYCCITFKENMCKAVAVLFWFCLYTKRKFISALLLCINICLHTYTHILLYTHLCFTWSSSSLGKQTNKEISYLRTIRKRPVRFNELTQKFITVFQHTFITVLLHFILYATDKPSAWINYLLLETQALSSKRYLTKKKTTSQNHHTIIIFFDRNFTRINEEKLINFKHF